MAMNGIDPPSPMVRKGLPHTAIDASPSASDSHGLKGGAAHPAAAWAGVTVTRAPEGGSVPSARWIAAVAASGSAVGGSRNDSPSVVEGRSTLPAWPVGGNPSAPM